jgi:hypothetical protein
MQKASSKLIRPEFALRFDRFNYKQAVQNVRVIVAFEIPDLESVMSRPMLEDDHSTQGCMSWVERGSAG